MSASTPRALGFKMPHRPVGRVLSPAVERLLDAAVVSDAGRCFPVVARIEDYDDGSRLAFEERYLGPNEALALRAAVEMDAFQPWCHFIDRLSSNCEQWRHRYEGCIAPELLDVTNADVFGPMISEVFTKCAMGAECTEGEVDAYLGAVALLLERIEADSNRGVFDEAEIALPVVGLRNTGAETHNRRQSVFCIEFHRGGRWAYKPRPANGEALLIRRRTDEQPGSLFDLINGLPTDAPVRLPTLRILSGRGPDGDAYSWHEWVEPPSGWTTIHPRRAEQGGRSSVRRSMRAPVVDRATAARFWRNAGSLTAVCYAFGLTDLFVGNVLFGRLACEPEELMAFPVDVEMFFYPVSGVRGTGLIGGAQGDGGHTGFESAVQSEALEGPFACFFESDEGLVLLPRSIPWGREESQNLLVDDKGATGCGPHALDFVRGMFDAWALMRANKERIARFLRERSARVRVIVKRSAIYAHRLAEQMFGPTVRLPASVDLSPEEEAQLALGDVPYFFRSAAGGALQWLSGEGRTPTDAGRQAFGPGCFADVDLSIRAGGRLEDHRLAGAIKDVLVNAYHDLDGPDLHRSDLGIRCRLPGMKRGEVWFDRSGTRGSVHLSWDEDGCRMKVSDSGRETDAQASVWRDEGAPYDPTIERRLLEIDRLDHALRERWVRAGRTDVALETKLRSLMTASAKWLERAVEAHGWPTEARVGVKAAHAACRIVQHVEGAPEFQWMCLSLIQSAVDAGDLEASQAAYVTDAVRVSAGEAQLFGTKFQRLNGQLVPFPIEQEEDVDSRRAAAGLEPLAAYTERMRRTFR